MIDNWVDFSLSVAGGATAFLCLFEGTRRLGAYGVHRKAVLMTVSAAAIGVLYGGGAFPGVAGPQGGAGARPGANPPPPAAGAPGAGAGPPTKGRRERPRPRPGGDASGD